jgi:hypothetical protein
MSIPLAVVATVTGLAACSPTETFVAALPPSASSTLAPIHSASRQPAPRSAPAGPARRSESRGPAALDSADGELPDDVTAFNTHYPAVTKLDPALLSALRLATKEAGGDGISMYVNSGWRSERYQHRLFAQAVREYGSTARASQWVARPGLSVHEAGAAVDIGPVDAAAWLSHHGAAYGLCLVYANEPWHYELRPDAAGRGCPATYADPTDDPRLQ